jgi:putative DNA primase/helicase
MRSSLVHETSLMLADLQDIGYFFNLDRKKELINYLNQLGATIEKKYTITEQTGWFGNNYVSQTKTYSADNKSDLKFRDIEPLADSLSEIKGTLAQWCQYIGEKCAGNSRLIFGIGIALAAILQPLLGIESGGFHLVGTTSVGKTTVMKVAASVVGIKNLTQWLTTTNGLESIASAHNHMLLPLDEIGQADAKDVGAIAYMLANGQGKTRMTKKLTNQKAKTWQLLFLSSGEEGMGQYMATAGMSQKGGQEVRLPDIPAAVTGSPYGAFENIHGCSSSKEFAKNLDSAAQKYHGTLLDGFLEKLVIDVVDDDFLNDRKRRLREISVKLATGTTDRAVSRVSTRFALIQVALEVAHGYGLLPFPLADIEWAIQTMFMDWLNSRGGDGSVEMRAAINRIQHLLVTNEFSDRVYTLPDNNDRVVRNLLGYRKLDASGSTEEFWIPPSVFEKEFCENMDKSELIKELQRVGLMIPARSDGKPRHQRKINSKPSYYYIFQTIKVPEAAEAAELPPSIVDTASVPPLPAPLPTTGSAEAAAQVDGLELPLPTLPMTGSGAEAVKEVLNPYISTSQTPASDASDASGEKTSNLELMVNDRAILTSTKEEGLVIATRTHQYQTPKSGLKTVHQCLVEFEAGDRKWLDADILVLTPKSSPRSI